MSKRKQPTAPAAAELGKRLGKRTGHGAPAEVTEEVVPVAESTFDDTLLEEPAAAAAETAVPQEEDAAAAPQESDATLPETAASEGEVTDPIVVADPAVEDPPAEPTDAVVDGEAAPAEPVAPPDEPSLDGSDAPMPPAETLPAAPHAPLAVLTQKPTTPFNPNDALRRMPFYFGNISVADITGDIHQPQHGVRKTAKLVLKHPSTPRNPINGKQVTWNMAVIPPYLIAIISNGEPLGTFMQASRKIIRDAITGKSRPQDQPMLGRFHPNRKPVSKYTQHIKLPKLPLNHFWYWRFLIDKFDRELPTFKEVTRVVNWDGLSLETKNWRKFLLDVQEHVELKLLYDPVNFPELLSNDREALTAVNVPVPDVDAPQVEEPPPEEAPAVFDKNRVIPKDIQELMAKLEDEKEPAAQQVLELQLAKLRQQYALRLRAIMRKKPSPNADAKNRMLLYRNAITPVPFYKREGEKFVVDRSKPARETFEVKLPIFKNETGFEHRPQIPRAQAANPKWKVWHTHGPALGDAPVTQWSFNDITYFDRDGRKLKYEFRPPSTMFDVISMASVLRYHHTSHACGLKAEPFFRNVLLNGPWSGQTPEQVAQEAQNLMGDMDGTMMDSEHFDEGDMELAFEEMQQAANAMTEIDTNMQEDGEEGGGGEAGEAGPAPVQAPAPAVRAPAAKVAAKPTAKPAAPSKVNATPAAKPPAVAPAKAKLDKKPTLAPLNPAGGVVKAAAPPQKKQKA